MRQSRYCWQSQHLWCDRCQACSFRSCSLFRLLLLRIWSLALDVPCRLYSSCTVCTLCVLVSVHARPCAFGGPVSSFDAFGKLVGSDVIPPPGLRIRLLAQTNWCSKPGASSVHKGSAYGNKMPCSFRRGMHDQPGRAKKKRIERRKGETKDERSDQQTLSACFSVVLCCSRHIHLHTRLRLFCARLVYPRMSLNQGVLAVELASQCIGSAMKCPRSGVSVSAAGTAHGSPRAVGIADV